MCGIAGISGRTDRHRLMAANRCQAHRGPDGEGLFIDEAEGVGLAHRRLSILDPRPIGSQPMTDERTGSVIVFNGEIYNFREIRRDLEARGARFRSDCDTEVLLQLLIFDGHAALRRLNGIFALAFWSPRNRELLIARDAFGVKPLYYSDDQMEFVFASEMRGLLELHRGSRTIDPGAIQRYLTFLWCPGDGTPLREVRKLGPGHALLVRDGSICSRWQWTVPPLAGGPSLQQSPASFGVAVEQTERYLREAVHRQLVSDVPIGAFLSGGLDSSSIVAFAREHNPDLQCFSIEIAGGDTDGMPADLPFARLAAQHLGVPLHVETIDAARLEHDVEDMVAQLGEPLADPAALNVRYIARLARQQGIKVLLSGAGGDDIFTGYRRHRALAFDRCWQLLPQALRTALENQSSSLTRKWPVSRRLAKYLSGTSLNGDERIVNYFHWLDGSLRTALLSPQFRRQLGYELPETPMIQHLSSLPPSAGSMERMLSLEQRFFLPDHNLAYTDRMSMREGVEVRVPFLDPDLVGLASSIPSHMKQRRSQGKFVLKKAMEPHLPPEIIWRPKTGFGAPVRGWFRGSLDGLVGEYLSTQSIEARGFFDAGTVDWLLKETRRGTVDASYPLFAVMVIEMWCREFLDR